MLQLLASEDEPLGLMQVATALDLPKGTVHGLLRTLSEVGFVTTTAPQAATRCLPTCIGSERRASTCTNCGQER